MYEAIRGHRTVRNAYRGREVGFGAAAGRSHVSDILILTFGRCRYRGEKGCATVAKHLTAVCIRRDFICPRERTQDDGMGVRETCDYARDGVAIGDCDDCIVADRDRGRRISVAKGCTHAVLMPFLNIRFMERRQRGIMTGDAGLLDGMTEVVVVAM